MELISARIHKPCLFNKDRLKSFSKEDLKKATKSKLRRPKNK